MGAADLGRLFDKFRLTAFRLETLPAYNLPAEAKRLTAFRDGRSLPERSPRTNSYLADIEKSKGKKSWQRVRVLDEPPTYYERFQLSATYRESAAAGEDIRILARSLAAGLDQDWWLFDDKTAALLEYDADFRFVDAKISTSPEMIERCRAQRDRALAESVPLAQYLADFETA
jgi:uncharacterized protein DUF6879